MIVDLSGVGLRRPTDGLDFSDLTDSVVDGPFQWLGEGRLEIPFTPDPTAEEQVCIRRRLVTVDAEAEDRVNALADAAAALAGDASPLAEGVRLLILERLAELRETPADIEARTPLPVPTNRRSPRWR